MYKLRLQFRDMMTLLEAWKVSVSKYGPMMLSISPEFFSMPLTKEIPFIGYLETHISKLTKTNPGLGPQ
jgi:predicted component of type VI protein secretion system